MKTKYFTILLLIYIPLTACVDEYKVKGIEELSELLVVDGMITDYFSEIILSKSIGLNEPISSIPPVKNAEVYIESEAGLAILFSPELSDPDKGVYVIDNGLLDGQTKYRLKINLDNKTYYSSFSQPLNTPAIDSISFTKASDGKAVSVSVSTHDEQMEHRFYKWSYNEIWEYNTSLFANAGITSDDKIVHYDEYTNTYYCWGYDHSKDFLLESSARLNENRIEGKTLLEITPSHNRLSNLYYIKVKQNLIRKEAYDYFLNLQKNIEQSGSIFAPIPSEMKGNLYCETEPDVPVIGYIDVSRTTVLETFNEDIGMYYEPPYINCEQSEFFKDGFSLYLWSPLGFTYATSYCVDCRLQGGTKTRPSFWPNDHY